LIRGLFGVPGRGGRHRLEFPRAGRNGGEQGPVLRPLHRPRQPLFPYAGGRRQGVADAADAGRPGAFTPPDQVRGLFAGGARPLERAFRTLQDRLPKELGLAGITSLDAANRWLAEVYLPEHNARFAVAAEQDGSAFVADAAQAWREILCIQEERQVGNDNTVKPNLNMAWERFCGNNGLCRLRRL